MINLIFVILAISACVAGVWLSKLGRRESSWTMRIMCWIFSGLEFALAGVAIYGALQVWS